jgi:multidrug efflux pump subunit AcrB
MAASAVLQAVTAALNVVGNAIKAQAAILAGQLSVNQQGTEYHQNVDYAYFQQANALQQQRTILIAVVVIAIVIFLFMLMFFR